MAAEGRQARSGRARPRREVQRVAAYAVILRDDLILMSRLADRLTKEELWTLPGGGLDHGESPHDAVVREVFEETGLDVTVGDVARVYSFHQPHAWRQGRRADAHAIRIVYDGWVPADAPDPHVTEVDGSTAEARWLPLAEVLDGTVPTTAVVQEALADHRLAQVQRVAAYALAVRGETVLLTRLSERGPFPGSWSLPGGGIGHGEDPRGAVLREVREETGLTCELGEVLEVDDLHVQGTSPHGRREDFHSVQLVFDATVLDPAEPRVLETDGTTAEAAWVPLDDLGSLPVLDLVHRALKARERRLG